MAAKAIYTFTEVPCAAASNFEAWSNVSDFDGLPFVPRGASHSDATSAARVPSPVPVALSAAGWTTVDEAYLSTASRLRGKPGVDLLRREVHETAAS
jgi:hypothetical protein